MEDITARGITGSTVARSIITSITRGSATIADRQCTNITITTTAEGMDIQHTTAFHSEWRCLIPIWLFQSVSAVTEMMEADPLK
jgi:hypothetical protein